MNLLPSLRPKHTGGQIQTAIAGRNDEQLAHILTLYALPRQLIYDLTWGKGAMWTDDMLNTYNVCVSDKDSYKVSKAWERPIKQGLVIDFTTNWDFYAERTGDVVILDPPYISGKQTHDALHEAYANDNETHDAVLRLYMCGILNAWRVLRLGGRIIVKCQDELSGGFQRWTHQELTQILSMVGFDVVDLFVLVNESSRLMQSHGHQSSARKNHSYWIVGMKPFARPSKRKGERKKDRINFVNENNA